MKKLPAYEELSMPLAPFSLNWFKWKFMALVLCTLGRLSKGIRIGFKFGFDSGEMLDYVYENTPQGITFLGRSIDKAYLNGPGWAGIRQRKVNLKIILREIIESNRELGKNTVIMDVAAGPGRYLIETIQENKETGLYIICRDMDEEGLKQGRELADGLKLKGIKYEKADAFSLSDLKAAAPKPNIIIVSGLYELFSDNEAIKKSMKDIFSVLEKGDYFIFTNQPYHPQLELIARILPNRLGKPWVMRLRPDELAREWAIEAGFEYSKTLIDESGIFSVNVAKKP